MYHGFGAKLALIFKQNQKEEGHMPRAGVWRWASEIIPMFLFTGFSGAIMPHHRAEAESGEGRPGSPNTLLGPKANHCLKHVIFLHYKTGILPYPHVPWFMLSENWN